MPPTEYTQFRSKAVCSVSCQHCNVNLCSRGMKAILLGDRKIELLSTDLPPSSVQLLEGDYMTRNCCCRIRDVACVGWLDWFTQW